MLQSKLCFHADLIFHLLAHMDLKSNASTLFSKDYIKDILQNKHTLGINYSLEQELQPFIDIYLNDFQKLCLINFFPFFAKDLEQTKNILLEQPFYTNEDKDNFLIPFFNMAQKEEDTFYLSFWKKEIEKYSPLMDDFNIYLEDKLSNFKNIFEFYKVTPNIYLSLSITQNGRGFNMKDHFTAITPLPKTRNDFSKFFIQAFHEMTHQFTDSLISSNISMKDGTHRLSEHLVILTDFYLFKKYLPSMLEDYCKLFGINGSSHEVAKEKYPIPLELREKLDNLLLQFQNISFSTITPDNWRIFNALKVKDEQKKFVAPNVVILARAFTYRDYNSRVYAIYNEDEPIGLLMHHDSEDSDKPCCILDQFMIAEQHQGKGYGKAAMEIWLSMIRNENKYDSINLCYIEGDKIACNLYLNLGFYHTGVVDEDEIVMEYILK